jgi:tetratricopeptide (TPR) repeat protein
LVWSYLKLEQYAEAENTLLDIKSEHLEKKNLEVLNLAKGLLFSQTKRFEEAVGVYDEIINSNPGQTGLIQAYIGKAEGLYSLSRFSESIKVYEDAFNKIEQEQIGSDLIDNLHYGCAWAYLKEGEFKKAISEFQKVAMKSNDKIVRIAALCLVADTYQDVGEFDKAMESYNKILKDYPDSFYSDYVQYQIGITFLKMSNYDGAILAFKALLTNFNKSKLVDDASYALGLTYFQKEDYNSSREIFKKFIDEFKDNSLRKDAMYLSGTSLYNLERFAEAIDVFKEIIRLYNDDIQIIQKSEFEIADCFYRMGNEDEAVSRFKSLRSKYPDSSLAPEVVWWLGEYYYRQGNFDLARRYFLAIIQDFPKSNLSADAYYALGSTYEQDQDYNKAIENFKKVTEIADQDLTGQATVAIGDMLVKQGDYNLALDTYQEAINKFPNLSALLFPKIADMYKKQGNYDEAIKFYRKSLEVAPLRQLDQFQFKIAESLQEQGKIDQAIEEYLRLTYLYPQDKSLVVKSLLRVAQIYEDKEKFKEADNIYDKISTMDIEEAKYAKERKEWIDRLLNPNKYR